MKRINYISFQEQVGYGIAAQGLIQSLRAEGAEVPVTRLLPGDVHQGGRLVGEDDLGKLDGVVVHTVPEYYPYWAKRRKAAYPSTPIWGYTAWETDRIPPHWPQLLNAMDGIFVPCRWNKEVFERCGVTVPVRVLPHVSEFHGQVGRDRPSEALSGAIGEAAGSYIFYSIGVWSERKGITLLLQAFMEEFLPAENITLIVKTDGVDWSSYRNRWQRWFGRRAMRSSRSSFARMMKSCPDARIVHIAEELSPEDIARLHEAGDCYVSFTRGEGWGMGAYEAAWFGNCVAITGYGGQLDYLPGESAYLLPYALVPVSTAYGRSSYRPDQQWAEVDVRQARSILRGIVVDAEQSRARAGQLRQYVADRFAPGKIAAACLEVF